MNDKPVPPWFRIQPQPQAQPDAQAPFSDVLIIGAGLAGSWLAYELSRFNVPATLLDAGAGIAAGASGNPAGVVKPFVTRAPSPPGDFYREAFSHLIQRLQLVDSVGTSLADACNFHQCGVLQLTETPYPVHADWQVLTPAQADRMAGTALNSHAIAFPLGGWLNPAALCQALLDRAVSALHFNARVHSLEQDSESKLWTVHCDDGRYFTSTHVVLANGHEICAFPLTSQIPIVPARGQLSRFSVSGMAKVNTRVNALQCVVSGRHYAMPDGDSIVTGATFQRNDTCAELRQHDDLANHDGSSKLLPELNPERISQRSYAGIRATTPDRFPVAGPLPDLAMCRQLYADIRFGGPLHTLPDMPVITGLSIIGGFGSRGIVSAPWTACSLASQILGRPLELTDNQGLHFRRMLANRFLIRDLMRWDTDELAT